MGPAGVFDHAVFVFEDVVGLHPALGCAVAVRGRHAHATERVLGLRADPPDEQRLRDRVRLEHQTSAGPQRPMHGRQRASRVCRHEVAEAVAPAQDPVDEPDVGQRPQVADDEPRVHTGVRGGPARMFELAGGEVDAGRDVPARGEADRQPPVSAWHVEHRGPLGQSEQLANEPHVCVGHRGAGRSPETGGQATVKADEPIVRHPRGKIPLRANFFNEQDETLQIGRAHARREQGPDGRAKRRGRPSAGGDQKDVTEKQQRRPVKE